MMDIRPLHAEFGAEILGCDLASGLKPDDAVQLCDAVDRYQLVVFRNSAALPVERQIELASLFGAPVDNGGGKLWSVLQNDEDAGAIKLPFHCDFSYTDSPIKVISLNALSLPESGTSTSFVSNVANWRSLPVDLRDALAPLHLRHCHVSQIMDAPEFIAEHPICKFNPRTGAPMLFVTEHHAGRILELDPEASEAMLARVFDHIYADERIYTHRWRLHDLLIWDNLAAQHARREKADLASGKRALRRVVISDAAFPELLERARRQQAARLGAMVQTVANKSHSIHSIA